MIKEKMKYIDFFSGAGGIRCGMQRAGLECVGFCEWDKYARTSYKAIYNTEGEWEGHDIRAVAPVELPRADLWCGGFPCFVADTLILTANGYIPIQDVKIGDLVLSHTGKWRKVTNTMKRTNAELWQVKGFGMLTTTTTSEHPYYVTKNGQDYSFVKVNDLSNEYLTTMIAPEEQDDDHTPEWWKLIGRYLADGWTVDRKGRPRGGRVVIACNDEKSEVLEEIITAAGYHYTKSKERTCNKYHIVNSSLYQYVKIFGKYAYGKKLPRIALELSKEKSKALFEGYLSGDGKKHYPEVTSVSPALILGMAIVAWKGGYSFPAIYKQTKKETCVIEGRTCNQRDLYMLRSSKGKGVKSFNGNDGYVCRRMEKPINLQRTGDVYNISVEEDESYIANGAIVHNCQDVSVAGKQEGLSGKRSGMFWEFIRLLREVPKENKPKWVLLENVKNLLSVGRGWDFARVITALGEVGYDVEWQLFNTKYSYAVGNTIVNGIPQNRERVFIIGRLTGGEPRPKVFPIRRTTEKSNDESVQIGRIMYSEKTLTHNSASGRIWDTEGISPTLKTSSGGDSQPMIVDDTYRNRDARVYTDACPTLRSERSGIKVIGNYMDSGHNASRVVDTDGIAPTVMENHGTVTAVAVKAVLTPDRINKRQNGRRMKEDGEPAFTLTAEDRHGVMVDTKIRKLTPLETFRLQGWGDEAYYKAKAAGISDSRLYKQTGNGVSANISEVIGRKLMECEGNDD